MKKILTILLFLISLSAFGQSYYVDDNGDDNTGDGSAGNPWKTIDKAGETVRASGSTIYVLAGLYVESDTIGLADGVSVRGDGITTIVTAPTITTAALFQLRGAAEGENGNQSISYIYFDGSDTTSYAAISVYGRSNVSINNCTFADWKVWAVLIGGRLDHNNGAPSTYATGNSFHHNIIINSSRYTSFGTGAFNFAGQNGILIYNNSFAQGGRPRSKTNKQTEGYLIKAYPCYGYNKGFKIYNNTFTTHENSNVWRFAIELFNCSGGVDIYDNTIRGILDFGSPSTGVAIERVAGYDYAVKIYRNSFDNATPQDSVSEKVFGVDLEGDIDGGTYIYENIFNNCASAIVTSQVNGKSVDSVFVYNNVINGIGLKNVGNYGLGIRFGSNTTAVFTNIQIYNNTINAGSLGKSPQYGIAINTGTGSSTNFIIRNNIVTGFNKMSDISRGIAIYSSVIDHINIDNNLIYLCAGSNAIYYNANTLSNDTGNNNLSGQNPLFVSVSNLRLQEGSPAINTGYNTGLTTDADHNTRDALIDIGAYELNLIPIVTTGIGWDDILFKNNFKDAVNFAGDLMIKKVPITVTATQINSAITSVEDKMNKADSSKLDAGYLSYGDYLDEWGGNYKKTLDALGSTIKAVSILPQIASTTFTLVDQQAAYVAIYIPRSMTITGIKYILQTAGSYTGDQFNGMALYSHSAGTLTRVAITANTEAIYEVSAYAYSTVDFTAPVNVTEGVYFVGMLFCDSGTGTAPKIYATGGVGTHNSLDLTNSNQLFGTRDTQTSLPASETADNITPANGLPLIFLY